MLLLKELLNFIMVFFVFIKGLVVSNIPNMDFVGDDSFAMLLKYI